MESAQLPVGSSPGPATATPPLAGSQESPEELHAMAVQAGLVEGQGSEEISSEMYTEEDRFWWDSRKKAGQQQELSLNQRLDRAALYIRDAFHGKELKKHRFNASAIRAYLFHQSKLWRYFVSLAMYIHLLLIFVEPDTTPSTSEAQAWLVVEGCCILVYVLDTVVKLFHMGFRDYIHNPMSVSFAILIILMFVDWVGTVSQWPVLRFSRPLRPFLIVFESSHLRRVMLSIVKTLPGVIDVGVFSLILILVYSVMGVQLLQGVYQDDDGKPSLENFDSIPAAMVSLFVLFTTENYPTIMYPATNDSWWYFLFFFSFIIIGVYIFASVLVAMIFESYRDRHKGLVEEKKLQTALALTAAFDCVDVDGSGTIDFTEWCLLLDRYFRTTELARKASLAKTGAFFKNRILRLVFCCCKKCCRGKRNSNDAGSSGEGLETDVDDFYEDPNPSQQEHQRQEQQQRLEELSRRRSSTASRVSLEGSGSHVARGRMRSLSGNGLKGGGRTPPAMGTPPRVGGDEGPDETKAGGSDMRPRLLRASAAILSAGSTGVSGSSIREVSQHSGVAPPSKAEPSPSIGNMVHNVAWARAWSGVQTAAASKSNNSSPADQASMQKSAAMGDKSDEEEEEYTESGEDEALIAHIPYEERIKMKVLYELVDKDGDGSISLLEFLSMLDVLLLDLQLEVDTGETKRSCQGCRTRCRRYGAWHIGRLRWLVQKTAFDVFILLVILLNLVQMMLFGRDISPELENILEFMDWVFLVIFTAEMVLKLLGFGVTLFWSNPWNRFDFLLVVVSLGFQAFLTLSPATSLRLFRVTRIVRFIRAFRALRTLRVIVVMKRLRLVAQAFLKVAPVLWSMSRALLLVFYGYAVFGVELMKGRLSNLPPDYDYDPIATFDNFPKAMLSLFQILTTSNWHDIMFKYIEAFESRYISWYFLTFFFFVGMVASDVLTAIILELFISLRAKIESENKAAKGSKEEKDNGESSPEYGSDSEGEDDGDDGDEDDDEARPEDREPPDNQNHDGMTTIMTDGGYAPAPAARRMLQGAAQQAMARRHDGASQKMMQMASNMATKGRRGSLVDESGALQVESPRHAARSADDPSRWSGLKRALVVTRLLRGIEGGAREGRKSDLRQAAKALKRIERRASTMLSSLPKVEGEEEEGVTTTSPAPQSRRGSMAAASASPPRRWSVAGQGRGSALGFGGIGLRLEALRRESKQLEEAQQPSAAGSGGSSSPPKAMRRQSVAIGSRIGSMDGLGIAAASFHQSNSSLAGADTGADKLEAIVEDSGSVEGDSSGHTPRPPSQGGTGPSDTSTGRGSFKIMFLKDLQAARKQVQPKSGVYSPLTVSSSGGDDITERDGPAEAGKSSAGASMMGSNPSLLSHNGSAVSGSDAPGRPEGDVTSASAVTASRSTPPKVPGKNAALMKSVANMSMLRSRTRGRRRGNSDAAMSMTPEAVSALGKQMRSLLSPNSPSPTEKTKATLVLPLSEGGTDSASGGKGTDSISQGSGTGTPLTGRPADGDPVTTTDASGKQVTLKIRRGTRRGKSIVDWENKLHEEQLSGMRVENKLLARLGDKNKRLHKLIAANTAVNTFKSNAQARRNRFSKAFDQALPPGQGVLQSSSEPSKPRGLRASKTASPTFWGQTKRSRTATETSLASAQASAAGTKGSESPQPTPGSASKVIALLRSLLRFITCGMYAKKRPAPTRKEVLQRRGRSSTAVESVDPTAVALEVGKGKAKGKDSDKGADGSDSSGANPPPRKSLVRANTWMAGPTAAQQKAAAGVGLAKLPGTQPHSSEEEGAEEGTKEGNAHMSTNPLYAMGSSGMQKLRRLTGITEKGEEEEDEEEENSRDGDEEEEEVGTGLDSSPPTETETEAPNDAQTPSEGATPPRPQPRRGQAVTGPPREAKSLVGQRQPSNATQSAASGAVLFTRSSGGLEERESGSSVPYVSSKKTNADAEGDADVVIPVPRRGPRLSDLVELSAAAPAPTAAAEPSEYGVAGPPQAAPAADSTVPAPSLATQLNSPGEPQPATAIMRSTSDKAQARASVPQVPFSSTSRRPGNAKRPFSYPSLALQGQISPEYLQQLSLPLAEEEAVDEVLHELTSSIRSIVGKRRSTGPMPAPLTAILASDSDNSGGSSPKRNSLAFPVNDGTGAGRSPQYADSSRRLSDPSFAKPSPSAFRRVPSGRLSLTGKDQIPEHDQRYYGDSGSHRRPSASSNSSHRSSETEAEKRRSSYQESMDEEEWGQIMSLEQSMKQVTPLRRNRNDGHHDGSGSHHAGHLHHDHAKPQGHEGVEVQREESSIGKEEAEGGDDVLLDSIVSVQVSDHRPSHAATDTPRPAQPLQGPGPQNPLEESEEVLVQSLLRSVKAVSVKPSSRRYQR